MSDTNSFLSLPAAPSIQGLKFRRYGGDGDIEGLNKVREAVTALEGDLWLPGPDTEAAASPEQLQNCLIAEVNGKIIGFTWLEWWTEADGTQLYLHLGWIAPEWRRQGIGRAILRWQEQRLSHIAHTQPITGPRFFGGNADDTQPDNRALLLSEGYSVAFTRVTMTCQIPALPVQLAPFPAGLELRPVKLAHLREIYEANSEAFAGSRTGYTQASYEVFLADLGGSQPDTSLWLVAWDGEQIAGLVINTVEGEEGRTPWVAVRPAWRQRGLGKALMTRTVQLFQERGLKHATLTTIAENPGKSVYLYESVGYHVIKREPRYRKPMSLD